MFVSNLPNRNRLACVSLRFGGTVLIRFSGRLYCEEGSARVEGKRGGYREFHTHGREQSVAAWEPRKETVRKRIYRQLICDQTKFQVLLAGLKQWYILAEHVITLEHRYEQTLDIRIDVASHGLSWPVTWNTDILKTTDFVSALYV